MGSDKTGVYRDSQGKRMDEYPRPSVAVDTAVLTVEPGESTLKVLQVKRDRERGWALPGTFLHEGERLIDAVSRSLAEKAGVVGLVPHQLLVFDDPDRDDRGWVLSVAHLMIASSSQLLDRRPDVTRLMPVDSPGNLPYGHGRMVQLAVTRARAAYAELPDPDRLLPEMFTVLELRLLHAAVAGRNLQKDTFRRAMEPNLAATGETTAGTRGRPAELFRRREESAV